MDFQARVSAWAAVHILAEESVEPPFGLAEPVVRMACEVDQPVDDLVLVAGDGSAAFVQVKRTVNLSSSSSSGIASALDQFVRQFLEWRTAREAEVPADPAQGRLILAVGTGTPSTVRVTLRKALDCLRDLLGDEIFPAGLNREQRRAIGVVAAHVRASWVAETSSDPGDDDIRALLRLVHVQAVEVGQGERDEEGAKSILRSSVLRSRDQASQAWSLLIVEGQRLIKTRAEADLSRLHDVLSSAGVPVDAPTSYRDDIRRLRDHSDRVARMLADHADIRLGSATVRIQRPNVPVLRDAVDFGSVLVVGEPGAGKSGVLYSLFETMKDEGRDVVLLAAQHPPFSSLGSVRDELQLDRDAVDVLANWPGQQRAVLLVDALDAARTDESAQALRTLIREVQRCADRWSVIATIREYDARYSSELDATFRGTPPDGPSPPLSGPHFAQMRHVVIGRLTDDELQQVGEIGAESLAALISSAPEAVTELLRVPFNLWLAAELLNGGAEPLAIRSAGSQLALLDLYWKERVLQGPSPREGPAREAVLRGAVRAMVSGRALHVDRDLVATVEAGPHISDLLSAGVLVEWQPKQDHPPRSATLALSHHVLFDYAVARLLLRIGVARFMEFLEGDPAFVLLGRPSLVMHFHHLWAAAAPGTPPEDFWEAVLAVCQSSEIPEIGKFVGPGVAAEMGMVIDEFEPLLGALMDPNDSVREAAESALVHCVRALLAERGVGPDSYGLLCDLAERLLDGGRIETVYPASWILWKLTDKGDLSPSERVQAGVSSRRLLAFAWDQSRRDSALVGRSMRCVCRTFATDEAASATLLRRAIEPAHLAEHGHDELSTLADEAIALVPRDPRFVGDLYRSAFGYNEVSDAQTYMRRGVMSFASNRRQDYQMVLYRLVESFPAFLEREPEEAVRAMNGALESYVARRRTLSHEDVRDFALEAVDCQLLADQSHIWDRRKQGHPDQYAIRLLDAVEKRLDALAERPENEPELAQLLNTVVRTCRLAVVWCRLFVLGSRHPIRVGLRIRSAAWATAVLKCRDTIRDIGMMIGAVAPHLAIADRVRIERAILSIPETASHERRRWARHTRNRLLGCLANDTVATSQARELLAELRAADAVPPNDPDFDFGVTSRRVGEKEHLADMGVPVDAGPNRRLRELAVPAKEFASAVSNEIPGSEALANVLPHLRRLHAALATADSDGVHEQQAEHAWGHLSGACASIAKMEDRRCQEDTGAFVRAVLLEASLSEVPGVDGDADRRFVEPSWGSPAARIEAASGLTAVSRHATCDDSDVLDAVHRLASDPAPAVRYQVARRLTYRYGRDSGWTWEMIERMAGDRSIGVKRGLVEGPVHGLRGVDPARAAKVAIDIRRSVMGVSEGRKLTRSCLGILRDLFVWGKDESASTVIESIADDPLRHLDDVDYLVRGFHDVLVAGAIAPPDSDRDAARRRSWRFLLGVTEAVAAAFRLGVDQQQATDVGDARLTEEQLRSLAQVLDAVGWNIYMASGAHRSHEAPSTEVLRRLYIESGRVIATLADVGLPGLSHRLMEALEVLVPIDPRGVFGHVARVVLGGRKGAYEYDSLAEDVLIRIVRRYLADHREIFQSDKEAQEHLIGVLDTFLAAGSEDARRLIYRLDQIFR